ncbi:NADPH-dependent F420 reductase [Gammaproteobacteria bacterium]|nr:NADPH-dependent F420 reductase [Gammaproteobacteria bacterium]
MVQRIAKVVVFATFLMSGLFLGVQSHAQSQPINIGIIGTGNIGGALARHWVNAGHEVFISSRHPEELQALADELGPRAHAGTPAEAAEFGEVVIVSVPYSAIPQIGAELSASLANKIVLDTSNPIARRDGAIANLVLQEGSGLATASFLPNARVVRAFNCIPAASLANQSNRQPERIAIPLAGDDAEALVVAQILVDDAGFDAVVVGPLEIARHFDLGQPLARGDLSATEFQILMDEVL